MPSRVPAIETMHVPVQSVQVSADVSHRRAHEPPQLSVVSGDDGGGIVGEPHCVVSFRSRQVSQHVKIFL